MSIIRDGREQAIQCERCSEQTETFDRDEFEMMVAYAKREGWSIRKVGREFEHLCPTHAEEAREAFNRRGTASARPRSG